MLVLCVGLAPSRSMSPGDTPLKGSDSWKRFAALAGKPKEFMDEQCLTVNLVNAYPGPSGKYDRTPSREAMHAGAAQALEIASRTKFRLVLAFGKETGRALGLKPADMAPRVSVVSYGQRPVFIPATWIPHPGGTNMYYNDPLKKELISEFLRKVFP